MAMMLLRYTFCVLMLFVWGGGIVSLSSSSLRGQNEADLNCVRQPGQRYHLLEESLGEAFQEFYRLTIKERYSVEKGHGVDIFKMRGHLKSYTHDFRTFKETCNDLGIPQRLLDQNKELIERMRLEMLAERNAPKVPHFDLTSLGSSSRKSSSGSESSFEPGEQPNEEAQIEGYPKPSIVRRKPFSESAASTDSGGSDSEGVSSFKK